MVEPTDSLMIEAIRKSLPILDSDEALQLLPPLMLEELYRSVTSSAKLVQAVYERKEVEKAASDSKDDNRRS